MKAKQENNLGEIKGFIKRLIIVLSIGTIIAGAVIECLLMYTGELNILLAIVIFPIIIGVVTFLEKVLMYLFLGDQNESTNSN